MQTIDEKLDYIISEIGTIKKALDIIPDKFITITDTQNQINNYVTFAQIELKLSESSIKNQKSAITNFLLHSKGVINRETVTAYLKSNDSAPWRTNQTKALRRFIRDYLKCGKWIESFEFEKTKAKIKNIPTDEELIEFFNELSNDQTKLLFLILHNSGLRIGEVLHITVSDIDFNSNMIDVSNAHQGTTKSSWISFVTSQTIQQIHEYIKRTNLQIDSKLFTISERSAQQHFKDISELTDIMINPHLLRTVFTEKCTIAKIPDKYINAFCGRVSDDMISKHYTDYSPTKLKDQYKKVEPHLTFSVN